ncbi:MAG: tetratricopeptide repeat protein [Pseudomonadota bacterium]
MKTKFLACALLAHASLSLAATDVGSIDFPTSTTSKTAQQHFLRGASILHSFGWKQAIQAFQKAQAADPDFAMAYWGESLCYNHPLLPERDGQTPKEVLLRLGPTLEDRLAKAPTLREQGFIRAVDALFFGTGNLKARRVAYMEAMRELHTALPDDPEIAAFYALSLISAGGAAGKEGERERILAGSIGLKLMSANNDHPGAAHYTIHAFDDPLHAILALPAAQKFASIAPAVSHARHMPSHIFIQLGMWPEVAASNQSAYEAAVDLFEPGDNAGDMVHALDWGQYGELQRGDHARAEQWIERMKKIAADIKGQARVEDALHRVQARYIIETRKWQVKPVTDASAATELFATGISAVELGDLATAKLASLALTQKAATLQGKDSFYNRRALPVRIMDLQLTAAIQIASEQPDNGMVALQAAVELTEQMPLPRGAPNPIKPAHEYLGEALLLQEDPQNAVVAFEKSLLRMPNRPRSLLGLARAQVALGNMAAAQENYARVHAIWGDKNLPELAEVRGYLTAQN